MDATPARALWLCTCDDRLDVRDRMTREILRNFANKNSGQSLVIMLAEFAQRPRCRDDYEADDLPVQHPLVEHLGGPSSEAVLVLLTLRGVCRAALMAAARTHIPS